MTDYDPKASRDALRAAAKQFLAAAGVYDIDHVGAMVEAPNKSPYMAGWDKSRLWDALATTLSFIAQWLLTRRYLQSWLLWFVADLVTAGLYYYKAAHWHASLYMIYLVIATIAYYKWKALRAQNTHQRS